MKLSECKGQSFLINGKIVSFQNVLKMIYEGKLLGPIALANIDSRYDNDLSNVMNQMTGTNEKDKSLNLLQTENIEVDITKEELKPLNASGTMFAIEKRAPGTILLSECLDGEYVLIADGVHLDISDVLGMIYNKKSLPVIQAVQMDMMYSHEYSTAMQKLYMNPEEIENSSNYELGMLKNKTVIVDITADKIEKVDEYDAYVLKDDMPVLASTQSQSVPTSADNSRETRPEFSNTQDYVNINGINVPIQDLDKEKSAEEEKPTRQFKSRTQIEREEKELASKTAQTTGSHTENVSKERQMQQEKRITYQNNYKDIPKTKDKTAKKFQKGIKTLVGWVINAVIFIAAIYLIANYLVFHAEIPSESMEPTLEVGDKLIGSRITYSLERAERGDVAIFKNPDNPEELFVKRIIGMPGETVTIKSGKIYIDDATVPLDEPYLKEEWTVKNDGLVYEVPEGHYFMLGDNRNISYDARYWENTYVPKENLIAEAVFRYFPLNSIAVINEEQDTYYQSLKNPPEDTQTTEQVKQEE